MNKETKRQIGELYNQLYEVKKSSREGFKNLKVNVSRPGSYYFYNEIPLEDLVGKFLDYLGLDLEFTEKEAKFELVKKPSSKKKKGA